MAAAAGRCPVPRGRPSKKRLTPGPDRVRIIVGLFQDSERKGGWTGGKAIITTDQVQQVLDVLGPAAPAWFQDMVQAAFGKDSQQLDYGQAKQILTLLDARDQKAQPADAAGGSQADQAPGKGVGAAPDQGTVAAVLAHLAEVLTDRINLQRRQAAQAAKDRPTTRKGYERRDQVEAWAAAEVALVQVILDSLAALTPDGWRLKLSAQCPWCGEDSDVVIHVKLKDGDLEAEDSLVKCESCGRGFSGQLVHYLATGPDEGWM